MKPWAWLMSAVVLTGCAAMPGAGPTPSAERPASEMPIVNSQQAAAKAHTDLGMAYLQLPRYDIALDEAKLALQFDPSYAPAYHLSALVYLYLDDRPLARQNFERAANLAPGDPEIDNSYGWFLCLEGQYEEAFRRLASAARNPYYRTPTRPLTNSGLCHLRNGDEESARAQLFRAVQADPTNVQAMALLASLSYKRADYEQARRLITQIHQLREPTAETAWLGLRIERQLGNRVGEESYAAQLRSRFPDASETQLLKQGRYD